MTISCNKSNKNEANLSLIDTKEIKRKKFNDLFHLEKVIPLETSPKSLIKDTYKIKLIDSLIYIHDSDQNKVLVFNIKGEYLKNIGKKGKGPKEYEYISDFYVESNIECLLLDGADLIHSYGVNSHNAVKFFPGSKFHRTEYGYWLYTANLSTSINKYDDKYSYNLVFIDKKNKVKAKRCKFNNKFSGYSFQSTTTSNFTNYKNQLLFSCYANDTIYRLNQDKITPYIVVDFHKKAVPIDFMDKSTPGNYSNKLWNNKYNFLTGAILYINDHILIQTRSKWLITDFKNSYKFNLYDKHLKTYFNIVGNNNDNKICCIINASQLKNLSKNEILPLKFKNILKDLKIDDNPIILIYSLKQS